MTRVPVSVLLVDDDHPFRHVVGSELQRAGMVVTPARDGAEALSVIVSLQPHVVLLDLRLPDMDGLDVLARMRALSPASEVIMLTGHGSIDTAIASVRAGAFDYVAKPCPLDELELRIQRALERRSLSQRTTVLERGLTPPDPGHLFVGASAPFLDLMELVSRVARSDSTVLINGETGSGKELVAKLLHARSPRRQRPFVVVECAALQDTLLQSELFGHERGAFTGAERDKPGLFEVAHGGTIFLDEIGEVNHNTQVKLLRVLDTSTFRRVGGTGEIHVDVRVLTATNRDLEAMVRQGLFREDLYYRISTVSLRVPPLRERTGDVDVLAAHFLSQLNERLGVRKRFAPETLALLRRHDWPGNVRELRHAVEAAVVVSTDMEIPPASLPASVSRTAAPPAPEPNAALPFLTLDRLEQMQIARALNESGGHRGRAARLLGISERNLYRKLRDAPSSERD